MSPVLFGIDVLLRQPSVHRKGRIGLVTNNAAATGSGELSRSALLRAGYPVVRLFSPEHGMSVQGEDGVYQPGHTDPVTGLPVISLYSDKLAPSPEELEDLDLIFFDIPDVGCRFYTYLWTLSCLLEACARVQKPLVILDRPNPIGGDLQKAEGPRLDEVHCSSFIGRWDIPVRHSCSLGELALYFKATRSIPVELEIIPVQNWNRQQDVTDAGWPFVPTSPAITDPETALLYPGMGLLEGINVNEGRGTTQPFRVMGAPWLDGAALLGMVNKLDWPGIKAVCVDYKPASGLYANLDCAGLQFRVTDPETYRPVKTGLQLLHCMLKLHREHAEQRFYKTVANPTGASHLDKLSGVYQSFEKISAGLIPATDPGHWETSMQPYLLY